jgi:hypothetical protein
LVNGHWAERPNDGNGQDADELGHAMIAGCLSAIDDRSAPGTGGARTRPPLWRSRPTGYISAALRGRSRPARSPATSLQNGFEAAGPIPFPEIFAMPNFSLLSATRSIEATMSFMLYRFLV